MHVKLTCCLSLCGRECPEAVSPARGVVLTDFRHRLFVHNFFSLSCCTRGDGDRFGIPNPRQSGSVIGADRQRFGLSCVTVHF
jgi:hypothetical protein